MLDALQAQLRSAGNGNGHASGWVVDASALQVFDSSALAVLLECRREALSLGKTFAVQGLPAALMGMAGLYGVDLLIAPGHTDAVRANAARTAATLPVL